MRRSTEEFAFGASCLLCGGLSPGFQAPKTTRVPVDGITSVFGIAMCTAMIMFTCTTHRRRSTIREVIDRCGSRDADQ